MQAVIAREPGGPDVLTLTDVADPVLAPGEVLIEVAAAGLNRADLLQRQGFYPPPPGASDVLGMECSGTIAALGEGVTGWSVGDEVCALLAGGGYASRVAVPAGQVMPLPDGVDVVTAAALPEVAATVWSNIVMHAGLAAGDRFLVHGGAGGIGSFAIQLAHALGASVATTVGSEAKAAYCRDLGADLTIDYRDEEFEEILRGLGGADVILDNMGAKYLARNVTALADGGRLVIIGMQGGTRAEVDINALMRKRGSVIGTTLRSRPVDGPMGKAAICAAVVEHVWPLIASGDVVPQVGRTFPMAEASQAHAFMESGDHTGKILLLA
ncbi:NAD(P)H-quinone oxidoreductase [Nocardioides sp.]|uniref:NAD(P)H-quinone oxidoreductase n=1 Tax=Nocardioides sp. TaxID=35761 RepID=UPI00262CBF03|nr:NAD(P)H-quinone oxidoreductase [Nocardioides sp.]